MNSIKIGTLILENNSLKIVPENNITIKKESEDIKVFEIADDSGNKEIYFTKNDKVFFNITEEALKIDG